MIAKLWSLQFIRFGLVGTVGFVVDTAVLYAARPWLGLYLGRVLSFIAAVLSTWLLNRRFTFQASQLSVHQEGLRYFALMVIGGGVNYAAYALCLQLFSLAHDYPILAVAAGSLSGMLVNFFTSKHLVYSQS